MNIINELNYLNNEYFKLFGNAYNARELLKDEKMYDEITERIFKNYLNSYENLMLRYSLEEMPKAEELKQRAGHIIPTRRRTWYTLFLRKKSNRAMKLIENKIALEMETAFRQRESALQKLEKALLNCETPENAFNEPTTTDENAEKELFPPDEEPAQPAVNENDVVAGAPAEPEEQTTKKRKYIKANERANTGNFPGQLPGQISIEDKP